jgi:hypothetical protein
MANNTKAKNSPNILILIAVGVFIFSLLILFAGPELVKSRMYQWSPENDDGQIGDAFAGTIGPMVAWLAAILTFAAFAVQFKANQQQREQFERQANDSSKQQFASKFFEMLRLHKENVSEIVIEGYIFNRSTSTIMQPMSFSAQNETTVERKDLFITGRSFFLYFFRELFSAYKICKAVLDSDKFKGKDRYLIKLVYRIVFLGLGGTKSVDPELENDNLYIEKCKKELMKAYLWYEDPSRKTNFYRISDSNIDVYFDLKYTPYRGHSTYLAHYYRHLFQMVKYVAKQPDYFISYFEKREFLMILRAQLSNHEQVLLYFNYLSGFGRKWENKENRFFSDYRMIHNMPFNLAAFTINPRIEFRNQIRAIRLQKEEMFEADE